MTEQKTGRWEKQLRSCASISILGVQIFVGVAKPSAVPVATLSSFPSLTALKIFGGTIGIGGAIAPIAPSPGYAPDCSQDKLG